MMRPPELFMELYPELTKALQARHDELVVVSQEDHIVANPLDAEFFDTSTDPELARRNFQELGPRLFISERRLSYFFGEAYVIIDDFGNGLSARYSELVRAFFIRYNLRYTLVDPFQITPSVSGMLASLMDQLTYRADANEHLHELKKHFERAVQVLSQDGKLEDVHRCIGNACNLTEGFARGFPGATSQTLGDLAKEL
jgi:hypothetical protein